MTGIEIGSLILLISMLIFIYPSMKRSITHSPKGSTDDLLTAAGLLASVAAFVFLLTQLI